MLMEVIFRMGVIFALLTQIFFCIIMLLKHIHFNFYKLFSIQGTRFPIYFLLFVVILLIYFVVIMERRCIPDLTSIILSLLGLIWNIAYVKREKGNSFLSIYCIVYSAVIFIGSLVLPLHLQSILILFFQAVTDWTVVYQIAQLGHSASYSKSTIKKSRTILQYQTLTYISLSAFCARGEENLFCYVISTGMLQFFILCISEILIKKIVKSKEQYLKRDLLDPIPDSETCIIEEKKESLFAEALIEKCRKMQKMPNEEIIESVPQSSDRLQETILFKPTQESGAPAINGIIITRIINLRLHREIRGHYQITMGDGVLWKKVYLILALDSSSSMTGSRWDHLKIALFDLFNLIKNNVEIVVSIFIFTDDVTLKCKEKSPREALKIAEEITHTGGGTSYERSTQYCCSLMPNASSAFKDYLSFVVFFSDGEDSYPDQGMKQLVDMKNAGKAIVLYTIGCEHEDDSVLRLMSAGLRGEHYHTSSSIALSTIFQKIIKLA